MGASAPQADLRSVVLVVDDEDMVREYMGRTLTAAGHHVLTARDGVEALTIVEGYAEVLELVVTDVSMPYLSGPGLVAEIGVRWPGLPVLYVSGRELPADAPPAAMLFKPFTPDALAAQVRALLTHPSQRPKAGPRSRPG